MMRAIRYALAMAGLCLVQAASAQEATLDESIASLPAATCGSSSGTLSKAMSIWPEIRSVTIWLEPL